jgi:alkanesulfonate monooxygenase SsuD/methylene tetrahydromethanopterin reductase-like flavin-dependent oxidoreductase (luciferase family)
MKFGVTLPLAGGVRAGEVLELGVAAEELGYESLWLQDDPTTAGLDAVAVLAMLAPRTRRVRLGFSILVLPQREVAATARAVATIDAASGGRVVLGVGVGSEARTPLVYDWTCVDRGHLLDEQLDIMRRLWAGETVDADGRWVRFRAIRSPRPAQVTLPVWIGTWGNESGLRRAVRAGEGWFGSGIRTTLARFAAASRRLDELCRAAGRDPQTLQRGYANCPLALANTAEEGAAMAAPMLAPHGLAPFEVGVPLIGRPDEARLMLARVRALEPDLVCVFPVRPDPAMLRRFRDEVAGTQAGEWHVGEPTARTGR